MTKYFYDFEFIEDGRTIDPISLGVVCEDGREYYAVFDDSLARPGFNVIHLIASNPWLMENVFPSLPYKFNRRGEIVIDFHHEDARHIKRREAIKQDLLDFTSGTNPELWAWYAAYDHVALCQIFGRMIDLPPHFPMYTKDIKQLADSKGNPSLPEQTGNVHNALEDARHNKLRFDILTS